MAELREDSLLFSLKEIFESEKGRVREEQLTREREHDRLLTEEIERARIRREGEERVQREVAARRRSEEQAAREHAARLEAIDRAEVERARVSADLQAVRQSAELERAHALRLAEIETGIKKRRYRALSWVFGVGWFGTALGAAGLYYGMLAPELTRLRLDNARTVAKQGAQQSELTRLLAASDARRSALISDLNGAREQIRALEGELSKLAKKGGRVRGNGVIVAAPPPPRNSGLDPDDPMNPDLR